MLVQRKKQNVEREPHIFAASLKKSNMSPSPLVMFPSRKDKLTQAFVNINKCGSLEYSDNPKWLEADKMHPTFGIEGEFELSRVKRSYRRIASSQLLSQQRNDSVTLNDLFRTKKASGKNYVLVEEDKLSELTRLENILRNEKAMLGDQCVMLLSDINVTARLPIPAVRLAMHNLCDAEMKKYSKLISVLHGEWRTFAQKNNYHKSFLTSNASYMKSAPDAHKISKLKFAFEANQKYLLRKCRDSMLYEDSLSRFADKYIDAELRRQDYERYYVLATKYGAFDELNFSRDAWPGTRYYKAVMRGALLLQKKWSVYWPIKKMRMHRAARLFQTLWRGYFAYRVWHPIIMLSLQVGKRSYYRYCWPLWLEYIKLCKQIKESLRFFIDNYTRKCFLAWRQYSVDQKSRKQNLLNRFARRIKNASLHVVYSRWAAFAKRSAHVKLFARRLFQNPHFHVWVQYTKMIKHMKRLGLYAVRIQACARGYMTRRWWKKTKISGQTLYYFYKMIQAKSIVRLLRDSTIRDEFSEWCPGEVESRHQRAIEKERRRLVWQHQVMQEKEASMKLDLKRHLRTRSGRIQLNELARDFSEKHNIDRKRALQSAKEELIARCSLVARKISKHDFNAKSPPVYTCADDECRVVCVSDEQYCAHVYNSEHHRGKDCLFVKFHLMLKHSKAQEAWRQYLIRTGGFDECVNLLDLWIAIQEWRKVNVASDSYFSRALYIYETFLQDQCIRKVNLMLPNRALLTEQLESLKNREFEGLYCLKMLPKSLFRRLLGLSGISYEAWTTDNLVLPDIYDKVEWCCLLRICSTFSISNFDLSPEGICLRQENDAAKKASDEALMNLFIEYRQRNFLFWTLEFVRQEKQLDEYADNVTNLCMASVSEHTTRAMCCSAALEKVCDVSHEEQRVHEYVTLLVDDTLYWTTENIVEDIYEHFVRAVIDAMWEIPDCRKQLLEFSGYLRKSVKSRLLIDMKKAGKSYDWFGEFLRDCISDEKNSLPLDSDSAALCIQRRVRGNVGRSISRKVFVNTFMKRFDQSSGLHYYVNLTTGTATWQRPLITRHVFPNSSW